MILLDQFQPGTFVDAIRFIGDNPGLLWQKTVELLELAATAIAIAVAISLPIGVVLGHIRRGSVVAVNGANVLRALPSLAVIALGLAFIGIGFWDVTVALVILAIPPILTNAYAAVVSVDPDAVEAARGVGMGGRQILLHVELPLSLPLIFAGLRTSAVFVVATATIAAVAGGGGLGDIIVNQASYRLAGVLAASLCVIGLAFLADGLFALLQRVVTPRGLTLDATRHGSGSLPAGDR